MNCFVLVKGVIVRSTLLAAALIVSNIFVEYLIICPDIA